MQKKYINKTVKLTPTLFAFLRYQKAENGVSGNHMIREALRQTQAFKDFSAENKTKNGYLS